MDSLGNPYDPGRHCLDSCPVTPRALTSVKREPIVMVLLALVLSLFALPWVALMREDQLARLVDHPFS